MQPMKMRNTIVIMASLLAMWFLAVKSPNIWVMAVGMIAAIGLTWYSVRRRTGGNPTDKPTDVK